MSSSNLPHADYIGKQLAVDHRKQAIEAHNARVAAEIKRAEAGEIINLSDLMAGKEEIIADEFRQRRSC